MLEQNILIIEWHLDIIFWSLPNESLVNGSTNTSVFNFFCMVGAF